MFPNENKAFNLLNANPQKMVKHTQTIRRLLPTNSLSVFDHFVGLALKVAHVVNIKLFFYGLILLWFDNINKVMQNPIQKFRQSSIVFEKSGFLSEKLKTLTSSNYHRVLMFFAETSHTFPFYQCLQRGVQDFFYFV